MRKITNELIESFKNYLIEEEKSENTIEKYIRDVRAFADYIGEVAITKESVITYKNKLISDNYAVRSINSMLASLNGLFLFSLSIISFNTANISCDEVSSSSLGLSLKNNFNG